MKRTRILLSAWIVAVTVGLSACGGQAEGASSASAADVVMHATDTEGALQQASAEAQPQAPLTDEQKAQAFVRLLSAHAEGVAWAGLHLGMPEAQVVQVVGQPLQLQPVRDENDDTEYDDYGDDGFQHCGVAQVHGLNVDLCLLSIGGTKKLFSISLKLAPDPWQEVLTPSQITALEALAVQQVPGLKAKCKTCALMRGYEMLGISSSGLWIRVPVDFDSDYSDADY